MCGTLALMEQLYTFSLFLVVNSIILFLGCPDDISYESDRLAECLYIDRYSGRSQGAGLKPIFNKLSRAEFLLTFSHLARSYDRDRRDVCQVATIVNPDETLTDEKREAVQKHAWQQDYEGSRKTQS